MPRPAHHPRRLGAVFLCAALGALVGACAGPSDAPVPAAPQNRPAPVAAVSYGMPEDAASLVLPTTGADTRGTQGLDAFGRLAAAWAVDGCAERLGETVPDSPPPMFTRYHALPDLAFLDAHGFGGDTLVPGAPPATRSTTNTPATPSPRLRNCLTEGRAVGRELFQIYGPLQSAWFAEIAPVDRAPDVRKALAGLGDCLTAHQVNARDESAFLDLVDQRLQAADATAARGLGSVYAACMKPVEAVREPLREKAAVSFRVSHAAEIARVRTELPRKIGELEKRYRIRISFPKA
ncbi:hypothetical protein [Streptomyces tanashiensis]|uniref:Lipoprotein n=1 Tax=Streptomyces tanashiensis TaxID=67367 RepID=A0ABY6R5N1_9ACTN|nr:hypothetical protein [Streptomyces tanashiensis]UZX24234.1 hypothetical protein LDH80_27595 [Streptomyces tanashiensis]